MPGAGHSAQGALMQRPGPPSSAVHSASLVHSEQMSPSGNVTQPDTPSTETQQKQFGPHDTDGSTQATVPAGQAPHAPATQACPAGQHRSPHGECASSQRQNVSPMMPEQTRFSGSTSRPRTGRGSTRRRSSRAAGPRRPGRRTPPPGTSGTSPSACPSSSCTAGSSSRPPSCTPRPAPSRSPAPPQPPPPRARPGRRRRRRAARQRWRGARSQRQRSTHRSGRRPRRLLPVRANRLSVVGCRLRHSSTPRRAAHREDSPFFSAGGWQEVTRELPIPGRARRRSAARRRRGGRRRPASPPPACAGSPRRGARRSCG